MLGGGAGAETGLAGAWLGMVPSLFSDAYLLVWGQAPG
jgi:hypothetical protein